MRALKTCAVLTENLDEKWRTKMAAPVHKIIIHSIQNNNTKSITLYYFYLAYYLIYFSGKKLYISLFFRSIINNEWNK